MISAALYDTKPYDQRYFEQALFKENIIWKFFEFHLSDSTAITAKGMEVVCIFVNDRLDRLCIAQLFNIGVKLIALRCAGYNNIDLKAAREFGLAVIRVPAYSPHAVAEHSVALLLTLNRHIHRAYNRVREHNFSLNGLMGFDLVGKTIGIIGTGKIGRVTAEIYRGFNCQVLAHDINPLQDWANKSEIKYTSLPHLLNSSDVISLHLPLTQETFHIICDNTIKLMKQGVYLINTSRGKLIDTTALMKALKAGFFGGIALDVYEEEEGIFFEDHSEHILEDDELNLLLTFHNVLITSHQAFFTHEALSQIANVTSENIFRFKDNQPFIEGTTL
ncbi:MAG: 2-hydroxyacid dehydrogenase [Nitrosomonas sp.]